MSDMEFAGIILAAGKGTRMKSEMPKCLHPVCELPMAQHLVRAMRQAGIEVPIVVVGHQGEQLVQSLDSEIKVAWQSEQLGTGHAVLMAKNHLQGFKGPVLVVPGDCPLIEPESLQAILQTFIREKADAVVASVEIEDPTGYGRIVRDANDRFMQIVEQRDASETQKRVREINVSVYCFESQLLMSLLPKLQNDNAQREYYLTDILEMLVSSGKKVIVTKFNNADEFQGVNDRWQLALAEKSMKLRILKRHALNGVTLQNVDSIMIGAEVQIEPDVTILSGSQLLKRTRIGSGSIIGPYTLLSDSSVGKNCKILFSHLVRCEVGQNTNIGPYANIRPHSRIGDDCKIGNFVEVKNATLDRKVSASHLSYIGDAFVGTTTNIGAGVIFCNYDGFEKYRTEIGENVFIGSNSTLVAPRIIGNEAIIAAGSVVTVDVPEGAGAFGRAKTEIKEEWAINWRKRKTEILDRTKQSVTSTQMEISPVEK